MWPFTPKPEKRSGGGYTDAIVAALENVAAASVADVANTAAVEAVAGSLSRAFLAAEVDAPSWAQDAITPDWLALVGRSLVLRGESLTVVRIASSGDLALIPAAYWNWHGGTASDIEMNWRAQVTTYGPSGSVTRTLGRDSLCFLRWGASPGDRYRGRGPLSWASLTAKTAAESERMLGDESAGPLAKFITYPEGQLNQDPDDEEDPLAGMRKAIAGAKGKALLVETTKSGHGEGYGSSPQRDWNPTRLGACAPDSQVQLADMAFNRMLAACGCPPGMFSPSTAQAAKEALRLWHMGTVKPLARLIEHELSARLETPVKLHLDDYGRDLAGRAQAFQKLVAGGVAVNEALFTAGLLADD